MGCYKPTLNRSEAVLKLNKTVETGSELMIKVQRSLARNTDV